MDQLIPPGDARYSLSVAELRIRLRQVLAMTGLNDQITVITDQGRAVAALVPADAARSRAQLRQAAGEEEIRRKRTAEGWQRRLDAVRDLTARQQRQRDAEAVRVLAEALALLDRLAPPGSDRDADAIRSAAREIFPAAEPRTGSGSRGVPIQRAA